MPRSLTARCLFCRAWLGRERAWRCPDCAVLIHAACARELEGERCPTPGCGSIRAWALEPLPRRRPEAALVLASGLLLAVGSASWAVFTPRPAAQEIARPASVRRDPPWPPWRAWPVGTVFVTRTVRLVPWLQRSFANGLGSCEGWSTWVTDGEVTGTRFRILVQDEGHVRGDREYTRGDFERRWRSDWADAPDSGSRWEPITVPAGTFRAVEFLGGSRSLGGERADLSTWVSPDVPVELLKIKRWEVAPGREASEVTELVAIELPGQPSEPPPPSGPDYLPGSELQEAVTDLLASKAELVPVPASPFVDPGPSRTIELPQTRLYICETGRRSSERR